jgi:hypothetical protein
VEGGAQSCCLTRDKQALLTCDDEGQLATWRLKDGKVAVLLLLGGLKTVRLQCCFYLEA